MPFAAIIMALFITSSCGGFKLFDVSPNAKERTIASITASQLLGEEESTFTSEVDDRLISLNSYYAIAHKNLLLFDESIPDKNLEELYRSGPYLQMMAVKTQVDEIESEIAGLYEASKLKQQVKHKILETKIREFAGKSLIKKLALRNLSEKLGLNPGPISNATLAAIEKEYEELEGSKEFQIYEKNIEHLSHLMEMRIRSDNRKFRPTSSSEGNVTGEEFPAKVWALTFDNGPVDSTTSEIIHHLKAKNLKATFFQLAMKSQNDLKTGRMLLDAGMEIGSNSHSYKDLTKVGQLTLEKEITEATKKIENTLKVDVKFFRLPFGSGVSVPGIRQTIARNNLIHVNWNIDTLDWMAQTPDKIIVRTKRLMKKTTRDSGIILFHDLHERSIEASAKIMDHLKIDGRRSCTIGKIVKEMNEGIDTVCLKN